MLNIFKEVLKKIYFYILKILLMRNKILIGKNVSFYKTIFLGYNKINNNCQIGKSRIGSFTYLSNNCILYNADVGSFTSIGPNVEIIYGRHPTSFISNHPIFYSTRKQCGITFTNINMFDEFNTIQMNKRSVIIGNDVWIGFGAKILEGLIIGDGAIILAGAYVTKNVEPYSVVGGIPAKHIKFRFNEDIRKKLLAFKWWDKDIDWLKINYQRFLDVDNFIKLIDKNNSSINEI